MKFPHNITSDHFSPLKFTPDQYAKDLEFPQHGGEYGSGELANLLFKKKCLWRRYSICHLTARTIPQLVWIIVFSCCTLWKGCAQDTVELLRALP